MLICTSEKQKSRKNGSSFANLTDLFRVRSGILDHLRCSLGSAAVVDGLGVCVDIVRTLTHGRHGLHDAVLGAQNGCGGVRVNALCFLSARQIAAFFRNSSANSKHPKWADRVVGPYAKAYPYIPL